MQQNLTPGLGENRLPVFATPHHLIFYSDDPSHHKQMLTVYNPYDFSIKFKVLCTAPSKFIVMSAEGVIKARCYIYIFIRHNAISPSNYDVTDKFRIQMYEQGRRMLLGKKDITAVLINGSPPKTDASAAEKEEFELLSSSSTTSQQLEQQHSISPALNRAARSGSGPNIFIIVVALVCIAALMFPTEGTPDSRYPSYFHLSVHQKLIFAYTLGLVTMVILRTQ